MRRLDLSIIVAVAILLATGASSLFAQDGGAPVVETDPAIPTVNQSVTITFNADEGDQGLEGFTGDVYAHTGVFTDESPDTWRCVKNYWPTQDQFPGNREDTKLTRVGPDTYELTIDDIRAFYNDNETGCTLNAGESIQTMNFVFRNSDGSVEGKAEGGQDIIVDLGDPEAPVLTDITAPAWSLIDPIVVGNDTSLTIEAAATADSLQSFRLLVDGTVVKEVQGSSLTDTITLDSPGRRDVRVEAVDTSGAIATDSLYAVRAEPTQEQAVPDGLEDGINYTGGGTATLVLQAPQKQYVHVVGDFTDWEVQPAYQMQRETNTASTGQDSTRYWIEISGLSPGQEYSFQYLVDGEIRIPDPYSEKVLTQNDSEISETTYPNLKPYPGGKANQLVSVLEPGQSEFQFSTYDRPDQEDLVIYELLVRDFIEKHNYQTLQDTLGYLDRMGVNAIELMPVSEYDGNQSWGYNPALYFATDKYYGPADELKQFIELAHQRGIAVILDVVYNHQTGQSPFIRLFNEGEFGPPTEKNPWANPEARHPFNVFNDNNHESPFTKYWLDRANEYWLEEFNVDGFRFDLSKGFTQTDTGGDVGAWSSYDQSRIDLLQRMADKIWAVDDSAYVILEHFAASDEEQELASYRADETGGMMLWNNMNEPYSQAAKGAVEGSGLRNTYYKNRGFSNPNYITYMESHDEQWLMYRNLTEGNASEEGYDIQTLDTALNRQKLVGAFFFTVPGPRMLWQFGELGYGYGDGGEQCLEGAGDSCPASAPGRTSPKPIRWDYRDPAQSPNRVRLYKAWSALINLRNQNDVFTSPDTEVSMQVESEERGRKIELQHSSMNAVIIGNFGVTDRAVAADFPSEGSWYDFFTGQKLQIESGEQETPIPLAPGEFHIYTDAPVETPEAGLVPFGSAAPPPEPPTALETTASTEESTIELSWTASSSPDVTSYRIYRGAQSAFDTTGAHVATVGPSVTSYTDTVEADRVYYYRVAALDNDGARSLPSETVSGLLYPEALTIGIDQSFGDRSSSSDYRLVALPGDISMGVASTFSGQAGEDWQVYRDNGSSSDFLKSFDGSSVFEFRPGRGFWAISDSSWSVEEEVETVPLRTTVSGLAAVVPLQEGWNIISNPLEKDIDWGRVEAANGGELQPLWRFDGSFRQTSDFVSAREGEAFYFNNRGNRSQLFVPYAAPSPSAETATADSSDASEGLLTFSAEGVEGTVSQVQVGRAMSADDGVGAEDVMAPPSRFEKVSLRVHSEASSGRGALMRSVQSAEGEGSTFALLLKSPAGKSVELNLQTRRIPARYEALQLVNKRTGAQYDLRDQTQVKFTPEENETDLALLAGTSEFVQKKQSELEPEELRLWPNYPNPFRERTTVEYTLPNEGTVTIEVFDILGRRIHTLVDQRQDKGLHQIDWTPSKTNGGLSSGIYILRLSSNGTTRTQKMTVIR